MLRDENGDIDDTKCDEAQYARYKTALANARDVVDYVCSLSGEYLEGVGRDGVIEILVDAPERMVDKGAGEYEPRTKAILLGGIYRERGWSFDPATDKATVTHEAIHAVTKGSGPVEEGLVYSMEALHMGGAAGNWEAGARKEGQVIYKGNEQDVVGNVMYRIFKSVGARKKDEVFEFALEVEREIRTSLYGFRLALVKVAKEEEFSDTIREAVAHVLVDMGINDLPLGTIPEMILRIMAAEMREIAAMVPHDDTIGAAAEEAMRKLREYLGISNDEPLR